MKLNIEQKRYNTERIKNIEEGSIFKDGTTNAYYIKTDDTTNGVVCVDIQNGRLVRYDKDTVVEPVDAEVRIEEY